MWFAQLSLCLAQLMIEIITFWRSSPCFKPFSHKVPSDLSTFCWDHWHLNFSLRIEADSLCTYAQLFLWLRILSVFRDLYTQSTEFVTRLNENSASYFRMVISVVLIWITANSCISQKLKGLWHLTTWKTVGFPTVCVWLKHRSWWSVGGSNLQAIAEHVEMKGGQHAIAFHPTTHPITC